MKYQEIASKNPPNKNQIIFPKIDIRPPDYPLILQAWIAGCQYIVEPPFFFVVNINPWSSRLEKDEIRKKYKLF